MKILFSNSPVHYSHGHHFSQISWPTLILPYLAAICGAKHEYFLHDHMTATWSLEKAIKGFKPDVIGFSIIASRDLWNTIRVIKWVIKWVRGCGTKLIAGGQGATNHSDNVLAAGVNTVFSGEAELTLRAINHDYWDWGYMEGEVEGKVQVPLDDCLFPRWDLVPLTRSRIFKDRFTGAIETSRGCPSKCDYCAITSYWKGTFRQKSNEKIIDELERLVAMGRTHIYLADDNFGVGWEKHIRLFNEILRRKLDIKWFTQIRPQTINAHPEIWRVAAEAGLYGVLVGYHNQDINAQSAEICHRNGIAVFESNIYGLPEQKSVWDYWPLFNNTRRNADIARFPMFSLLPGSKIGDKEITANALEGKEGDLDYRLPLRSKGARRTFQHGMLFWNILHLILDFPKLLWYNVSNKGIRKKFINKDYGGIVRYWIGRAKAWTGV